MILNLIKKKVYIITIMKAEKLLLKVRLLKSLK